MINDFRTNFDLVFFFSEARICNILGQMTITFAPVICGSSSLPDVSV